MSGIANDISGVGEAATAVGGIAKTITDTLFKIFPGLDKEKTADAARELETLLLTQQAAQNASQTEVNRVEAGSPNLFVSGWRPFVGWICGAGFAWAFVIGPMFAMCVRVWKNEYALPVLDTQTLGTMLLALLGLGGMHTFDKLKGTTAPATPIIKTRTVTTLNGKTVKPALPV